MSMPGYPSSTPAPARGYRVLLLAIILLAGAGLRIGYAAYRGLATPPETGTDQEEYDLYAWNLAQGRGYRGPSPDVADQDHATAYRPPGPSFVMACVYAVAGHRHDAARVVNCLLGTASIWLLYLIGARTFGSLAATWAAAVYACYPLAVMQSGELLSEPLGVFLFLWLVLTALRFDAAPSWRSAVATGVVLALGLLTRPNYVFFAPLLLGWILIRGWGRPGIWRQAAIVCVAAGLTIAPWAARNYGVFGKLIPFSTAGGSALLQGNNREILTNPRYAGYSIWDTELPEYREALRSAGDEVERDRRAGAFAVEWLKANVDQWPALAWNKFARSWTPWLTQNPSRAHQLLYAATWGPVLTLLALGFIPTLLNSFRRGDGGWIVHLAILHFVPTTVIFFANIRYRAPVDPLCILVACAFLAPIWISRRPRPST
ncbi:MAG TPA: glycosyltransferase family 39 protein [Planctomycetia bacterium]|nr:glycosyltransferase family 39 protein [Planctomycetia bacterium]